MYPLQLGIRDTSVTAKGVNMRTLKLFPRISIVTGLLLEKLQQVVDFGGFRINCSNVCSDICYQAVVAFPVEP
uniref:Uncharacterized protein n=1 Tax=Loa loa TaxID=7209 RepID=A0A1I7V919_LOALO